MGRLRLVVHCGKIDSLWHVDHARLQLERTIEVLSCVRISAGGVALRKGDFWSDWVRDFVLFGLAGRDNGRCVWISVFLAVDDTALEDNSDSVVSFVDQDVGVAKLGRPVFGLDDLLKNGV